MLVKKSELANFHHGLIDIISSLSYKVGGSGTLIAPIVAPLKKSQFKVALSKGLNRHVAHWIAKSNEFKPRSQHDTFMVPLVQIGYTDICHEKLFLERLLQFLSNNINYDLSMTTGYFNLPDYYQKMLLKSSCQIDLLTASPEANGFYGAKGIIGMVPTAYNHIEDAFAARIKESRKSNIVLRNYKRTGWSYHAKGIFSYSTLSFRKYRHMDAK